MLFLFKSSFIITNPISPAKLMKNIYQNVLVVDDNEADQLIARKIIQLTGFAKDVAVKNSKQSALDFLSNAGNSSENLPDVIFLDINRPGIDGISFLHEFENLPDRIKENCKIIILSSTHNRQEISSGFISSYVRKVLVKPLTVEAFSSLTI
jgi:CheY-like chemotaxis protein